jgi:hypothetical protein
MTVGADVSAARGSVLGGPALAQGMYGGKHL